MNDRRNKVTSEIINALNKCDRYIEVVLCVFYETLRRNEMYRVSMVKTYVTLKTIDDVVDMIIRQDEELSSYIIIRDNL